MDSQLDRAAVGYIIVAGLRDPHACVELRRIVIGPKGRGFGREALRWVVRQAFTEWNAHRLWLDVKENNHAARALYESEGFVNEGIRRECLHVDGRFESLVVMSMLRQEYARMTAGDR